MVAKEAIAWVCGSTASRKQPKGFVLMELLIVIAVIGILAAILLPALARARETGRRKSCMANLNQMGMAMHMYADEHNQFLPWSGGGNNAMCLFVLHKEYIAELATFVCPSDANAHRNDFDDYNAPGYERKPISDLPDGAYSLRTSYEYFGAYANEPLMLPHPSSPVPLIPIMWDIMSGAPKSQTQTASGWGAGSMNHIPGGGNVLWLDGSVEFKRARRWTGRNLPAQPPRHIAFMDPSAIEAPNDE